MDKPSLSSCFQFRGAWASKRWPTALYILSPTLSSGFQICRPSMFLPPLPRIGATSCKASVQIDSLIKGWPNSFVDSMRPKIKSSIIPSSSALPCSTLLSTVWIGLVNVSYAFKWEKSM